MKTEPTILGDNWRLENFELSASKFIIDSWVQKKPENEQLKELSYAYSVLLLAHSMLSENIDTLMILLNDLRISIASEQDAINDLKARITEQGKIPIDETKVMTRTQILGLNTHTELSSQYLWRRDNLKYSMIAERILLWLSKKPNNKQLREVCSDYISIVLKHSQLSEKLNTLQMQVSALTEYLFQVRQQRQVYESQFTGIIESGI